MSRQQVPANYIAEKAQDPNWKPVIRDHGLLALLDDQIWARADDWEQLAELIDQLERKVQRARIEATIS